jgi:rSAM-associated Gly-rich repeat protein
VKITTKSSWVGFLIALSALNIPVTEAASSPNGVNTNTPSSPLEIRLSRIVAALKERENYLSESDLNQPNSEIALGWINGRGGRGFVNARRGGWGDGYRGGFANINPWRNGWRDGGGFYNYRRY